MTLQALREAHNFYPSFGNAEICRTCGKDRADPIHDADAVLQKHIAAIPAPSVTIEALREALKRPDWKHVYNGLCHTADRDDELIPVTRETLRLAQHALRKQNEDDFYYNNGCAEREIIDALADGPTEPQLREGLIALRDLLEVLKTHKAHFYEGTWTERERKELMEAMHKGNAALSSRSLDGWKARNAVIEECAEAARGHGLSESDYAYGRKDAASDVRALKESKHD